MEKQQLHTTEPESPIFSQQDSIENPPKEQQSSNNEQTLDYSQTALWQLRGEPASGKRKRAIKGYQPVTTSYVTEHEFQGCDEQPEPSQDRDNVSNSAAVVMIKPAVQTVAYVPHSSEQEALNFSQQVNIGNTSQKQKPTDTEHPPAYTRTPDYPHITTWDPNQPTGGYPMRPTKGYQTVSTSYPTAQSHGHVHEAGPIIVPQPQVMTVINVPYINDYLPLSIFSCLCCCWILGCFAILGSLQVRNRLSAGDYEGAKEAQKITKRLAVASVVIGGLFIVFLIALRYF